LNRKRTFVSEWIGFDTVEEVEMPFNRGHALLIGVGAHEYVPSIGMPIMVADAEAIASVLEDDRLCGYPRNHVRVLHDAGATKAGILSALDELAARTTAGDTVFLFYSGYGAPGDDNHYYLVSNDARIEDGQMVAGTGVSEAELLAKLQAIPAEHVLMVFSASHFGSPNTFSSPTAGASDHLLSAINPPQDVNAALVSTGKGRAVITSCREGQKSYVGNGLLTIFTEALFDGLRGRMAEDGRQTISLYSLYEHIYETVGDVVQEAYGAQQEPELTVSKGILSFPVALYKGQAAQGEVDLGEPLPEGAVREVELAEGRAMLERVMQSGVPNLARAHAAEARAPRGASRPSQAMPRDELTPIEPHQPDAAFHQATAPAQQAFVDLIKRIRRAIQTSGMSDDEKAVAFRNLDGVDMQLAEPTPELAAVERGMNGAAETVNKSPGAGDNATEVGDLVRESLDLARQLYK
jgi:hypothetical protein